MNNMKNTKIGKISHEDVNLMTENIEKANICNTFFENVEKLKS